MSEPLAKRPANPALWAFICAVVVGVATALIERQQPGSLPFHSAQITGLAFLLGGVAAFAWNRINGRS